MSFTLSIPSKSQPVAKNSQGIAAVVNNDIITQLDLNNRLKFIIFSRKLSVKNIDIQKMSSQVLRSLVDDKLKLQEAERLGIKLVPAELKATINRITKANGLAPGKMLQLLAERNIDINTFENRIEADLAWRKAVVKTLRSSFKVSDKVIDQRIAEIQKNKGNPEYAIAEIFIPFSPAKSLEKLYQSLDRIFSQLKRGANFYSLARTFSQSASAINGGNLGWIRTNQIDPNLSSIVTNLKKGETSAPVKGEDGYYILRLLDKRISKGIKLSNTKISIQQVFIPINRNSSTLEVNNQKKIANNISSSANSCSALEKIGNKMGSKASGLIEIMDTSTLPLNIQATVANLPLLKASDPIQMSDGYLVLMICKRNIINTSKKIRNNIKTMILEKKAGLISRRMLRNIRRLAFIDIRR
jgi:peptidyl-prolyl cis-trans isomerase SurA